MEDDDVYQNVEHNDIKNTFSPQTQNHRHAEGKAKNRSKFITILI